MGTIRQGRAKAKKNTLAHALSVRVAFLAEARQIWHLTVMGRG